MSQEDSVTIPENSENKPRGLYFSKVLFEGLIFGIYGMYTLIAVYAPFNRFIDLTINSYANPYNLASSRLL